MATPLWGGPPGTRPAFLFTAPGGRGKGKSKLAQFIARVYGGSIDISPHEEIGVVKQRLLTPGSEDKRVVLIDNVKSHRFSWSDLESLITAPAVSGKRLWVLAKICGQSMVMIIG